MSTWGGRVESGRVSILVFCSDVNKDLTHKVKANDLNFKAKVKAKDLTFKAKVTPHLNRLVVVGYLYRFWIES